MTLESIKFGPVLWENNGFSLCQVVTSESKNKLIALIANCLRLKKIIPSIAPTIREVSREISTLTSSQGKFSEIIDSGVTPDLNPFLIIKEPEGTRLSEYAFSSSEEIISVIRQIASCLTLLHKHNLFQRDLDANWDVYFDGTNVVLAFPAAREMFHKAYVDADDGATVFDIPRFIVMMGSVLEDVKALMNLGLGLVSRTRGSDMALIQYFLIEHFQDLETGSIEAGILLDNFTRLEVSQIRSYQVRTKVAPVVVNIDLNDSETEKKLFPAALSVFRAATKTRIRVLFVFLFMVMFYLSMFFGTSPNVDQEIAEAPAVNIAADQNEEFGSSEANSNAVVPESDSKLINEPLLDPTWQEGEAIESGSNNPRRDEERLPVSDLQSRANSSDFEVRITLAKELADTCEDSNRENYKVIITQLLKDPDVLVRAYTVRAYLECYKADAIPVLEKMHKEEESELVKGAIEKILKKR